MAYFMFKLRQVFYKDTAEVYRQARGVLTAFGTMTMILLVATITVAFMCKANFGMGLRERIEEAESVDDQGLDITISRRHKRMTIW